MFRLTQIYKASRYMTPSAARYYSGVREGGGSFSKKEKAAEDQYVRQHEAEQLKKLKEQLEKTKQEVKELEEKLNKKE